MPPACVEAVKRICDEYQIVVAELWTYTTSFDQVRFTLTVEMPAGLFSLSDPNSSSHHPVLEAEPV